jgi:nucleoside-diphosphate-sugar epimerase
VCKALSQKGYTLVATGRNIYLAAEFEKRGVKFIAGDLVDPKFVDSLFDGIDYVVHCAALTNPFGRWKKFYQANVVATKNCALAAKKFHIKRFIHLSTPSVYYDGTPRLAVREDEPIPKPRTNYAKSKLMADALVDDLKNAGVETITLRPRAIFGPNDHVILPRILRLMVKGRFPLFNKGSALVDMTYIENVIHAIELSLKAPSEALYKKYNITNGEPRSFLSICKEIQQCLGLKVNYFNVPLMPFMLLAKFLEGLYMIFNSDKEPALTQYSIGLMSFDHTLSIEEAQKFLHYEPIVPLSTGLKKTLSVHSKRYLVSE